VAFINAYFAEVSDDLHWTELLNRRSKAMSDTAKLKDANVEEILAALRARERKALANGTTAGPAPEDRFPDVSSAVLAEALRANQKVIYGTDDRIDFFQITDPAALQDVDGVVALFNQSAVTDNGNGTSTLRTQNFGTSHNLCPTERFRDQPVGAFCSGFLVAPDVIATAGHCVTASNVTNVRFVFGFRMTGPTTAQTVISNNDIYSGASLLGRQEVGTGPDWALVQLDRPVSGHRVVPIRRDSRIPDAQAVHVIGHPSGLPLKFAAGAAVRDNSPAEFFIANLDTYGGNSGSPVFNAETHVVEGILVRGETDFVSQGNCRISLVCPSSGCRGEDCTRTTEFASLLPQT